MSPWPDPLLILTAALTLAAVLLLLNMAHARWRRLRAPRRHVSLRGYAPTPKTPAPEGTGPPRTVPSSPGPGHAAARPAPAPVHHPRLLMTSRFYSDGVVYIDDHIKHVTRRFDPPADNDGWDAAAERLIRDLSD